MATNWWFLRGACAIFRALIMSTDPFLPSPWAVMSLPLTYSCRALQTSMQSAISRVFQRGRKGIACNRCKTRRLKYGGSPSGDMERCNGGIKCSHHCVKASYPRFTQSNGDLNLYEHQHRPTHLTLCCSSAVLLPSLSHPHSIPVLLCFGSNELRLHELERG